MSALTVRGLDVEVGGARILSGLSFELHPGELCAIIGPSGAGKSTLIKVLLGLRRPTRGEVRLEGGPVEQAGPVGYVPQDDALHLSLTVARSLHYAARLRLPELSDEERAARVREVCERVGLADRMDLRVSRLSGGQRKRVSVAMELLTRPPLLVLDEPTSGLDPGMEARSMALFAELARQGGRVLVSTHAMQSLDLVDLLMVLVGGHLAWFGPPGPAPEWFRAPDLPGVFSRLSLREPAAWARAWSGSPLARQVRDRPPPIPGQAIVKQPMESTSPGPPSAEAQLAALKARLRGEGGP